MDQQDQSATLADDDIETRPLTTGAGSTAPETDDADSGDTSDTSDTGDTGDDTGDTTDTSDTGDDSA